MKGAMKMQITKLNCPQNKIAIKCPYTQVPEMIVVHNTAGRASAMSEVSYMLGNNNYVSFHYAVDNERVVQGIDENRCAWHAGNYAINLKSISIEICYSMIGGEIFEQSERNAAKLIASILKRYGWGIDRVRYHKEFANTSCPHRTLELGWERFLNLVREQLGQSSVNVPQEQTQTTGINKQVRVTSSQGLNARSGAGTNYAKVGAYAYNTVLTIIEQSGDWGKTSNNNWVCLTYTSAITNNSTINKYKLGRYRVNSSIGLNVRTGPGTNYNKKKTYSNGTIFDTYQISENWAKTPSGWVCLDYAKLIYAY